MSVYSRGERDDSPALGVTRGISRAGHSLTVKPLDDRRREVRELLERTNEMLARKRAGLVQGWLKGYVDVFVVGFDVDNPKLGIVLECARKRQKGGFPARAEMADHGEHASHVDDDQALVLPRYVKIVECDQKGIIAASPRFQIFDDRPIILGKPLYLLAARVLADKEGVPASANGELTIFFTRVTVACGEPVYKKVETASQAVDDCACFRVDDRVWRDHVAKAKALLSRLRVRLSDNAIGGYLIPDDQPPFKHVYLGYGPLDAGVNI
jgi:hypothetical protein